VFLVFLGVFRVYGGVLGFLVHVPGIEGVPGCSGCSGVPVFRCSGVPCSGVPGSTTYLYGF